MFSDFIWDFRKLPFPSHLGKYFIKIGKISAEIHEIGKIKAIFGLEMTPILGPKNGQIKSLVFNIPPTASTAGFETATPALVYKASGFPLRHSDSYHCGVENLKAPI